MGFSLLVLYNSELVAWVSHLYSLHSVVLLYLLSVANSNYKKTVSKLHNISKSIQSCSIHILLHNCITLFRNFETDKEKADLSLSQYNIQPIGKWLSRYSICLDLCILTHYLHISILITKKKHSVSWANMYAFSFFPQQHCIESGFYLTANSFQ